MLKLGVLVHRFLTLHLFQCQALAGLMFLLKMWPAKKMHMFFRHSSWLVLFSVSSARPCSHSPLRFQNRLLCHIGGLLFNQGHLILLSWAIKLIMISCYFHLCTVFFAHVLYLGICMLSGLPTRFRLSFLKNLEANSSLP